VINKKVSVLIANYNNAKHINECIQSIISQKYQNVEIIIFDDSSNDNSISEIKKFKNVELLVNDKRGNFGSFNQMNAYKEAFKRSSGEIIFFLDSDDYFHDNKISKVLDKFNSLKDIKIIYDLPIYKYLTKIRKIKYKKKIINNYWPYIHPQSCIAIKRELMNKIFEEICFESFSDIWLDFRISLYSKYIIKNSYVLKENLTFYRQSNSNISSNFRYLSQPWWVRRLQAHRYVEFFFKKNNVKYKKNLDYFITLFINKFIK
jgi:glycosyltransferase involved in cell wall biosynthesis